MNQTDKLHSGWANYPQLSGTCTHWQENTTLPLPCIAQGNLRSYGDSALAEQMVSLRKQTHFLNFDEHTGILHCQSGVLLREIIEHFLPRGWFPLVCPGTQDITLGGAIASDVHGKNHHAIGAFSESVVEFSLYTGEQIVTCSKTGNPEWFYATCGGMGLTGVILDAKIRLQKVHSCNIQQTTIKTRNLEDTFEQFERFKHSSYSVAWIDCISSANKLGRGILTVGEHATDHQLEYRQARKFSLPFYFPAFSLNPVTLKILNTLIYQRVLSRESTQQVGFEQFFFPLDGISHWNRGYGKPGFVQYQFVLPMENSLEGMREILTQISKSNQGSFLVVLKKMGDENRNWLSFPKKGYTLAIDFKNTPKVHHLLNQLDLLVNHYGGRFYLAKDARISPQQFEQGYPQLEAFRAFRKQHQLDTRFVSAQSRRLGL